MEQREFIRSLYLVFNIMELNPEIDRKDLKEKVKTARDFLTSRSVFVDFDFSKYQSGLTSKKLDGILEFCISAEYIQEKECCIKYKITETGLSFLSQMRERFQDSIDASFITAVSQSLVNL